MRKKIKDYLIVSNLLLFSGIALLLSLMAEIGNTVNAVIVLEIMI